MASHFQPNIVSFLASAALIKGSAVKAGADNNHVAVCSAATQKVIGLVQNAPSAAEAVAEVAIPGGGAKGLLGGTVSMGDLLASDAAGALVATTSANDKIIAQAMEDGVAGDLISVNVVIGNY